MSYFSDFVEYGSRIIKAAERSFASERVANIDPNMYLRARNEEFVLRQTLGQMLNARIIRMPAAQANVFFETSHIPEQDFSQMHSPYPLVYCEFNQPVILPRYIDVDDNVTYTNVKCPAIMIIEIGASPTKQLLAQHTELATIDYGLPEASICRMFQVCAFTPLPPHPYNNYIASFALDHTQQLIRPNHLGCKELSDKFVDWAIHVMNYLTSPSVVLERKEVDVALQHARQRRGKEPLPGWYEISYRQRRVAPAKEYDGTQPQYHHSFRYDVRGHFNHITKGRMAGRVIWIPAHQRGLVNALYRPKSYRTVPNELPAMPEPWRG